MKISTGTKPVNWGIISTYCRFRKLSGFKANTQFQELQVQLEGTENRIAVARNRYITTVQDYNAYVRQFPQAVTAKVIGMHPKANFSAEASAQQAPKVSFD